MKKRPSITLLTVLLAMVFAAGIGVYSSYIGMKIYQESSDHLLESFSQISETFTLFVQRNWTVLSQWDGLLKNADIDHADSIGADMQANKESWHYSDFYLFNESTQYLTADGRRGSADSLSGVIQEMYSEGGPIVSTYTASYGVPKIAFAMPLSRNMTLDGVTYTGWRMPTYAEMLLLDILQNVSKSEIKEITDRHRYWTADPASNSAFRILNPSGGTNGENASYAEVRCVRDIDRPL